MATMNPVPTRRRTGLLHQASSTSSNPSDQHFPELERTSSPPVISNATFLTTPRDFRFIHNWRLAAALVPALWIVASTVGHYARIVLLVGYVATFALDEAQFSREHALISVWITVFITAMFLWVTFISAIRISPWNLLLAHNMTQVLFLTGLWGALQFPWIWRENPTISRLMERLLLGILPLPVSVLYCWMLSERFGSKQAAFVASPLLTVLFSLISIPLPRSESPNFTTVTAIGWIERVSHTLNISLLPALLFLSASRFQAATLLTISSTTFLVCFPFLLINSLPFQSWQTAFGLPRILLNIGSTCGLITGCVSLYEAPIDVLGFGDKEFSKVALGALLMVLTIFGTLSDACGMPFALWTTGFSLFVAVFPPSHVVLVGVPCVVVAIAYFVAAGMEQYKWMKLLKQEQALKRRAESPSAGPRDDSRTTTATSNISIQSSRTVALLYWMFVVAGLILIWDGTARLDLVIFFYSFGVGVAIVRALKDSPSQATSATVQHAIVYVELIAAMCYVLMESSFITQMVNESMWRMWMKWTSGGMLFMCLLLSSGLLQRMLVQLDRGRLTLHLKKVSPKGKGLPVGVKKQTSKPNIAFPFHPPPSSDSLLTAFPGMLLRILFDAYDDALSKKDEAGAAKHHIIPPIVEIARPWLNHSNLTKILLVMGSGRIGLAVNHNDHTESLQTMILMTIACVPIPFRVVGGDEVLRLRGRIVLQILVKTLFVLSDSNFSTSLWSFSMCVMAICVSLMFESAAASPSLTRQGRQEINLPLCILSLIPLVVHFVVEDTGETQVWDYVHVAFGVLGFTMAVLDIGPSWVYSSVILVTMLPAFFLTSTSEKSLPSVMTLSAIVYCLSPSTRMRLFTVLLVGSVTAIIVVETVSLVLFEEEQGGEGFIIIGLGMRVSVFLTMYIWLLTAWAREQRYERMGFQDAAIQERYFAGCLSVLAYVYLYLAIGWIDVPVALSPFLMILFLPVSHRRFLPVLFGIIQLGLHFILKIVFGSSSDSTTTRFDYWHVGIAFAQAILSFILLSSEYPLTRNAKILPAWFAAAIFSQTREEAIAMGLVVVIVSLSALEESFHALPKLYRCLWQYIPDEILFQFSSLAPTKGTSSLSRATEIRDESINGITASTTTAEKMRPKVAL